jgi:large subunit ribosomal protein L10
MSKYVKQLVTDHIAGRLEGVDEALLVNVIGMEVNDNNSLRGALEEKNISLMVVKNSLARRAMEGSPLSVAFEGVEGSTAIVWGAEDFVSLAKEVVRLAGEKQYAKLESRGGVMDGEQLSPEQVTEISKWPSRSEQLSLLIGQILSPGAALASQLNSAGGALASQIEQISEKEGPAEEG